MGRDREVRGRGRERGTEREGGDGNVRGTQGWPGVV